jgi:hypothetical protein
MKNRKRNHRILMLVAEGCGLVGLAFIVAGVWYAMLAAS